MLPAAVIFHGAIVAVLWFSPATILADDRHVYVVSLQLLFGLAYLVSIVRKFTEREKLITACVEDEG